MNRKRLLILTVLFAGIIASSPSYGQNSRSVYFELLGASNGLGVNYDARFNRDASSGLGWRIGLGSGYRYSSTGLAYDFSDSRILEKTDESVHIDIYHVYDQCFRAAIPLEINYLLGKGSSKFEIGAGGFLAADLYTSRDGVKPELRFGAAPYLSAGYRLVTARGFFFRAGALPSFNFRTRDASFWPYLAFGWAF
ncbi:MAG: hypothetical protein J5374_00755 [Bacteroidales bacterium]|nr:hypothetical protein [Bacteroidales bacterium]